MLNFLAAFLAPTNASPVIERLWQGGRPKPGTYSFHLIVLADDMYQPAAEKFPGAEVLHVPLPDDWRPLTKIERAATYARAARAGEIVAAHHRKGHAVLVTCGAGLNRSGLVNGIALRSLGFTADASVALIRRARGDRALGGKAFRDFIANYTPAITSGAGRKWLKAAAVVVAITATGGLAWVIGRALRRDAPLRAR